MSVRPNHSSPAAGSTRRAIARRASDTTFENVASRTSRSHSAVRARVRVERWRWVASQAISSRVFDRSKTAEQPCSSTTSTGPRSLTSNDQSGIGCLAVRRVIRVVGAIVSQLEPSRGMLDELGDGGQLVADRDRTERRRSPLVRAARSTPGRPACGAPRREVRRRRPPAPAPHASGSASLDLAHVVGRHEHDRRFPRLATGHPRAQRERRLASPAPCSRGVTWRGRTRRRTSRTRRGGDDRRTSPDPTRHPPVAQPRRAPKCRVWRRSR